MDQRRHPRPTRPEVQIVMRPGAGGPCASILRGFAQRSRELSAYRWRILDPTLEQTQIMVRGQPADGLVFLGPEAEELAAASQRPARVILLNMPDDRIDGASRIRLDDHAVGTLAAEYFLRRGYRNQAYCGHERAGRARLAGFYDAVKAAGARLFVPCSETIPEEMPGWLALSRGHCIDQWLLTLPEQTAVFCFNDVIGLMVIASGQRIGRDVPIDLAVLGVDNAWDLCDASEPRLSSIDAGHLVMGIEAANLMERLLGGASPETMIIKPQRVVERGSTSMHVDCDPTMTKALHFIEDELRFGVKAEEVASFLKVSRSTLERLFRTAMGVTPTEQIRRMQLARACKLLEETRETVTEIYRRCGFESLSVFDRTFKREVGLTPAEYRRSRRETAQ